MSATLRAALFALSQLDPDNYHGDVDVDLVLSDVRSRARDALSRAEQESDDQRLALITIGKLVQGAL